MELSSNPGKSRQFGPVKLAAPAVSRDHRRPRGQARTGGAR